MTMSCIKVIGPLLILMFCTVGAKAARKTLDKGKLHQYIDGGCSSVVEMDEIRRKAAEMRILDAHIRGVKINETDPTIFEPVIDDIILTKENIEHIIDDMKRNEEHHRSKRTAFIDPHKTGYMSWYPKSTFTYTFYDLDDDDEQVVIKRALAEYERKTCLRFERGSLFETDIIFTGRAAAGKCASMVGQQKQCTYGQPIWMGHNCFPRYATSAHEIGHLLGLFHEHSREDRLDFIDIDGSKGDKSKTGNFDPEESNPQGLPYDFQSMMHYPPKAFGHVITTDDEIYSSTIGQRSEISFYDGYIINKNYCRLCDTSEDCKYGGYRHIGRCYEDCTCPDGLGGELCDQIACNGQGCLPGERILMAEDDKHCLTSPGYDDGGYHPGDQCTWLITARQKRGKYCHIKVEFKDDFEVPARSDGVCDSWVEVRLHNKHTEGQRFCGNDRHEQLFPDFDEPDKLDDDGIGPHGEVLVNFRSFPNSFRTDKNKKYKGFKLCYKEDDC